MQNFFISNKRLPRASLVRAVSFLPRLSALLSCITPTIRAYSTLPDEQSIGLSNPSEPKSQGQFKLNGTDNFLKSASTMNLVSAALVYKFCTMPKLVNSGPEIIDKLATLNLNFLSDPIIKKTFFDTFCAGENRPEVEATMARLKSNGINSLVGLSVEADVNISSLVGKKGEKMNLPVSEQEIQLRQEQNIRADVLTKDYIESINIASSQKNSIVALKLTCLIPVASMYRLSLSYLNIHRVLTETFALFPNKKINLEQFTNVFLKRLPAYKDGKISESEISTYSKELFEFYDLDHDGMVDQVDIEVGLNLENSISHNLFLSNEIDIVYGYTPLDPSYVNTSSFVRGVQKADFEDFTLLQRRLDKMCQHAENLGVEILIDGEHSYFQPVLDQATLYAMRKFNSLPNKSKSELTSDPASGYYQRRPVIMNTYQMFTKSGLCRLQYDFEKSKRLNYVFGAKLVRGAYLDLERKAASHFQYVSPIHETIEDTHNSYNSGVQFLISKIQETQDELNSVKTKSLFTAPENELAKNPVLFAASHNRNTVEMLVNEMIKRGITPEPRTVMFGQLLGMHDAVGYELAEFGVNVYKYVPYGPLHETIPFLVRRAQENSAVLSAAAKEVSLRNKEILRRLMFF
ncbi:hypothetical protein BB560_004861 [Smittium megazygosporum]|uniref:Proline dehydrogenase n=1 Tax=Smittium megazygosporum TaxID=133381 RepID=A0A2T9Z877_9FUNG|nr:hypothetical protein BB560_004861 [Smittium megazygosporum]